MFHSIHNMTVKDCSVLTPLSMEGDKFMNGKNQWVISKSMAARERGLLVQIDGKHYYGGYNRIRNMVREDADYMSDYVYDEQGKIVGLQFNKIGKVK